MRNKATFQNKTLPQTKTVDIKKGGNVVKTITVRQKSKYFNDKRARNPYCCIKYCNYFSF